jgi:hypothetical protein
MNFFWLFESLKIANNKFIAGDLMFFSIYTFFLLFQGFLAPMIIISSVKTLKTYSGKKIIHFTEQVMIYIQQKQNTKVSPMV